MIVKNNDYYDEKDSPYFSLGGLVRSCCCIISSHVPFPAKANLETKAWFGATHHAFMTSPNLCGIPFDFQYFSISEQLFMMKEGTSTAGKNHGLYSTFIVITSSINSRELAEHGKILLEQAAICPCVKVVAIGLVLISTHDVHKCRFRVLTTTLVICGTKRRRQLRRFIPRCCTKSISHHGHHHHHRHRRPLCTSSSEQDNCVQVRRRFVDDRQLHGLPTAVSIWYLYQRRRVITGFLWPFAGYRSPVNLRVVTPRQISLFTCSWEVEEDNGVYDG